MKGRGQVHGRLRVLQSVTNIPEGQAYRLSDAGRARLEKFLACGEVPTCIQEAMDAYFTKKAGRDWHDPVIMDRIRSAIVAQKDDYWKPHHRRSLKYTSGYSVLGYLAYHFPVYFMQTQYLLAMLAADGLVKPRMNILDIGTGPGVVPLAIADFCSHLDGISADVFTVERAEEHIEAFLALRDACVPKGGKVSLKTPIKEDIVAFDSSKIPKEIDLVVFSNVLNELRGTIGSRAEIVQKVAGRLAPDGSILIIEPAEENTATQLRILALALKKEGLTIHSPCTFLHGTNCTPDRCWSFVPQQGIRPTRIMETLAASTNEPFRYINTDIKYSYVVLRKDTRTRHACRVPAQSRVLRLALLHRHIGKRVNVVAVKMSGNLGDEKTLMFRVCDGSVEKPVFAVLPAYHVTPENQAIVDAPYGTVLALESILVRYNPAHDAYNLFVSRNTGIRNWDNSGL